MPGGGAREPRECALCLLLLLLLLLLGQLLLQAERKVVVQVVVVPVLQRVPASWSYRDRRCLHKQS